MYQEEPLLNLVFGEDISRNVVLSNCECMLVGIFLGRKTRLQGLKDWVSHCWARLLGYEAESFVLSKGWIVFWFQNATYSADILKGFWSWDTSILTLKPCTPLFYASKEWLDCQQVWLKLPNLPFDLWSLVVFKEIGNSVGSFAKADKSSLATGICRVAKIIVTLDLYGGFPE